MDVGLSPAPQESADPLAHLRSLQLGDDFWQYSFKVLPCPHGYRHSWTHCPFAHVGETARRRCPRSYNYLPEVCPNAKAKRPCPAGDACPYAHNTFEQWLHPMRYRTRLCYLGATCRRSTCFFAHSVDELRHVEGAEGSEESTTAQLLATQTPMAAALLATPPPPLLPSGSRGANSLPNSTGALPSMVHPMLPPPHHLGSPAMHHHHHHQAGSPLLVHSGDGMYMGLTQAHAAPFPLPHGMMMPLAASSGEANSSPLVSPMMGRNPMPGGGTGPPALARGYVPVSMPAASSFQPGPRARSHSSPGNGDLLSGSISNGVAAPASSMYRPATSMNGGSEATQAAALTSTLHSPSAVILSNAPRHTPLPSNRAGALLPPMQSAPPRRPSSQAMGEDAAVQAAMLQLVPASPGIGATGSGPNSGPRSGSLLQAATDPTSIMLPEAVSSPQLLQVAGALKRLQVGGSALGPGSLYASTAADLQLVAESPVHGGAHSASSTPAAAAAAGGQRYSGFPPQRPHSHSGTGAMGLGLPPLADLVSGPADDPSIKLNSILHHVLRASASGAGVPCDWVDDGDGVEAAMERASDPGRPLQSSMTSLRSTPEAAAAAAAAACMRTNSDPGSALGSAQMVGALMPLLQLVLTEGLATGQFALVNGQLQMAGLLQPKASVHGPLSASASSAELPSSGDSTVSQLTHLEPPEEA